MTPSERIAQKLNDHPEDAKACKEMLVNKLFKNELFNQRIRARVNQTGQSTSKTGITDQSECENLYETELHENVLGVFIPVGDSVWIQELNQFNLPFIAGPSGHTGSAMLLALLMGNFNEEELKQYVTATIGILTGGGYHSIHEIMSVASKVGITYVSGKYHHFLPNSFLDMEGYVSLANDYPDYLPARENLTKASSASSLSSFSFFHTVKQSVSSSIEDMLHYVFESSPHLAQTCPSYIHPKQMIWQTSNSPASLHEHASISSQQNNQLQLPTPGGSQYIA
jgi:hypothetical protein